MKETEKTTAEKIEKIAGKPKPDSRPVGFGKLRPLLDRGEELAIYRIAYADGDKTNYACHRVSETLVGKTEADKPKLYGLDAENWPPMEMNEFFNLLDEGRAFVIKKIPNGKYVVHEIAEISDRTLILTEPKDLWTVISLSTSADEHDEKGGNEE